METPGGLPVLLFTSSQQWEEWLDEHHARTDGVWLTFAKKGSGLTLVSYGDAVEVALCYGWIDGQAQPRDERCWVQKFTPRRPRSPWSAINIQRATRLIESGRMKQAGLRQVDAAKQDGRWDRAYASPSTMAVPDDFMAALDAHPEARAFFETLNKANRYAMCYRIETAKKPETRRARIEKFITMLANHEKLHPQA